MKSSYKLLILAAFCSMTLISVIYITQKDDDLSALKESIRKGDEITRARYKNQSQSHEIGNSRSVNDAVKEGEEITRRRYQSGTP